ncbi:MAG: hypothetical protein AAGE85_06750 [Pseudomonadota bacterium]
MTESAANPAKRKGQWQLMLIAAVFLGPLALATWLYYGGAAMQPEGRTNHGLLLEPITNLRVAAPDSGLHALQPAGEERWQLAYAYAARCGDECRNGLYTIRQVRLMLGREMERVERVFLHGDAALDTLFLEAEHSGLVTLGEASLAALLAGKLPAGAGGNGYYLIDPLGNLVLYFPPGIEPRDMVSDIKRLLRLSSIG